jgi:hypothetical protein
LKRRLEYPKSTAPNISIPLIIILVSPEQPGNGVKDVFFGGKDPIFLIGTTPGEGKVSKSQIGKLKFKI